MASTVAQHSIVLDSNPQLTSRQAAVRRLIKRHFDGLGPNEETALHAKRLREYQAAGRIGMYIPQSLHDTGFRRVISSWFVGLVYSMCCSRRASAVILSLSDIAEMAGIRSKRAVEYAIEEAVRTGWIQVHYRFSHEGAWTKDGWRQLVQLPSAYSPGKRMTLLWESYQAHLATTKLRSRFPQPSQPSRLLPPPHTPLKTSTYVEEKRSGRIAVRPVDPYPRATDVYSELGEWGGGTETVEASFERLRRAYGPAVAEPMIAALASRIGLTPPSRSGGPPGGRPPASDRHLEAVP